jgi:hypothetical protein
MAGENVEGSTELDSLKETVGSLITGLDSLKTIVSNQAQGQSNMQQSLQSLTDTITEGFKGNRSPEQTPGPVDFSDMNMSDVATHLIGEMKKISDASVASVREELDSFKADSAKGERSRELESVLGRYKDGEEWISEMRDIATNNPNLSIEQMYKLARSENPTKASEMDEKFADKQEEEEEEPANVFAGLTPTSSGNQPLSLNPNEEEKVTVREGLEKAWDEAMPDALKKASEGLDPFI